MQLSINNDENCIKKENEKHIEIQQRIHEVEGVREELKEKLANKQILYFKEKDEPTRLSKGNENIRIAVEHLKADYQGLIQEADKNTKFKQQED